MLTGENQHVLIFFDDLVGHRFPERARDIDHAFAIDPLCNFADLPDHPFEPRHHLFFARPDNRADGKHENLTPFPYDLEIEPQG